MTLAPGGMYPAIRRNNLSRRRRRNQGRLAPQAQVVAFPVARRNFFPANPAHPYILFGKFITPKG